MLTQEQRLAMLDTPGWPIDVVIDTDTFNEIDDQFAVSYALRSRDRLAVKALYAAPFLNHHSLSPEDGSFHSRPEDTFQRAPVNHPDSGVLHTALLQNFPDGTLDLRTELPGHNTLNVHIHSAAARFDFHISIAGLHSSGRCPATNFHTCTAPYTAK